MSLLHMNMPSFRGPKRTQKNRIPVQDEAIYKELTPIGQAAYDTLAKQHKRHKNKAWNLTHSQVVGSGLWNTPRGALSNHNTSTTSNNNRTNGEQPNDDQDDPTPCYQQQPPQSPHDEWLPRQMGDLIGQTTHWCDITSLSQPDGLFLEHFQRGLKAIYDTQKKQQQQQPTNDSDKSKTMVTKITIRLLFGNVVGTPLDCNAFIRVLTSTLPPDAGSYLQLWVGSWRKKVSWNHSKIIAIDGRHLWTGGHNLWTHHYCRADPVHDVSVQLYGGVAVDAHGYANHQWQYIRRKQSSWWGHVVDQYIPDGWEVPRMHRVTVSEYPMGVATEFPPAYEPLGQVRRDSPTTWKTLQSAKHRLLRMVPSFKDTESSKTHHSSEQQGAPPGEMVQDDDDKETKEVDGDTEHVPSTESDESKTTQPTTETEADDHQHDDHDTDDTPIPVLSIGRFGAMVHRDRPADDALVAMMDAAQTTIQLAIQDMGPMQIPGTHQPMPGTTWPQPYLHALARAIWKRRVDVEMILSNPQSVPGHLGPGEFIYGNGWTACDVASEIIKAIRKQFPFAFVKDEDLHERIRNNLRICYLRAAPNGTRMYECGQTLGLHAKHYIFDSTTCYIGSQNLYDCDLAEWGVVLDSPSKVQELKQSYWDRMWRASFCEDDCPVDQVMKGLSVSRDAPICTRIFQCAGCRSAGAAIEQDAHPAPQNPA